MTRRLRQRHRVMFCALGVVLPLAFAAGIAARKPVPVMANLPSALRTEAPRFESVVWERDDLWAPRTIRTRLLAGTADRRAVELGVPHDIVRPDLLVYWAPGEPGPGDAMPADAVLLGAFTPRAALSLLAEAAQHPGWLILYSLADHEVVARSQPFTF
jgi:hypothetical protein